MTNWTVIIEDLAQLDLKEVYAWYEQQKTGLGGEFIDELDVTILALERNPLHVFNMENLCRSTALKRFPYDIIYLIDALDSVVNIIAISHQHRKPGWFAKKDDEDLRY